MVQGRPLWPAWPSPAAPRCLCLPDLFVLASRRSILAPVLVPLSLLGGSWIMVFGATKLHGVPWAILNGVAVLYFALVHQVQFEDAAKGSRAFFCRRPFLCFSS